jgi:hypothetical protein
MREADMENQNTTYTYREKLIDATADFIHKNVPKHSRAQYEALLATNTDLAIELVAKWRDLEDLKVAHRELQYETAKGSRYMPPVTATAQIERHSMHKDRVHRVRWEIDPCAAHLAISDMDSLLASPRCVVDAFHRYFHDKYVPELWRKTEETLFLAQHEAGMRL